MNLLEIAQLTNTLCGLQGNIDTISNLKEMQADLVRFIRQANLNIQLHRKDWKFMTGTMQVALTALVNTVDNDNVSEWKRVIHGKTDLRFVDYETYLTSDWSEPRPPAQYTVVPETNQLLVNTLDNTYTFTVRYIKVPKDLLLNTDVPLLPVRFHSLIAYSAAASFGSWLGSPEIEDKNLTMADTLTGYMMQSEVPARTLKFNPLA